MSKSSKSKRAIVVVEWVKPFVVTQYYGPFALAKADALAAEIAENYGYAKSVNVEPISKEFEI